MSDKTQVFLIFLLVHSWWIGPLCYFALRGALADIRERADVARNQKAPVSFFVANLTKDGTSLILWILRALALVTFVLIILALFVTVSSFAWELLFGPSYGPEFEAYRR